MQSSKTTKVLNARVAKLNYSQTPLQPSHTLQGFGHALQDLAKSLFNAEGNRKYHVSLGYYGKRLETCVERFFIEGTYEEVIASNLLTYDLLRDLMLFSDKKDPEASVYLFSKYMRIIELVYKDQESVQFYNWLYQNVSDKYEAESNKYYHSAAAGSVFLLFHEFIHREAMLRTQTQKILFAPDYIQTILGRPNDKMTEEMMCDFLAMAFVANRDLENHFSCSKDDFLRVSLLSMFLPGTYKLLNSCRMRFKFAKQDTDGKVLTELLNTRVQALSVFIKGMQQIDMFFDYNDLRGAIDYACDTVHLFLLNVGELLQSGFVSEINDFNRLPDDEKEQYSLMPQEHPWFLIS